MYLLLSVKKCDETPISLSFKAHAPRSELTRGSSWPMSPTPVCQTQARPQLEAAEACGSRACQAAAPRRAWPCQPQTTSCQSTGQSPRRSRVPRKQRGATRVDKSGRMPQCPRRRGCAWGGGTPKGWEKVVISGTRSYVAPTLQSRTCTTSHAPGARKRLR